MIKKASLIILVWTFFFCGVASASKTQEKPKVETKKTNIVVMDDSLADGVWMVLRAKLKGRNDIKLTRYARASSGICRKDFYDWVEKTKKLFIKQRVDILVILIGGNDNQGFFQQRRSSIPNRKEKEWVAAYEKRAEEITGIIRKNQAYAIWLGLPSMRSKSMNNHALRVNRIYSDVSDGESVEFIPTWSLTVDKNNHYQAYHKDAKGRLRNLRASDGVHFTMLGYSMITERTYQKILVFLDKPEPAVQQPYTIYNFDQPFLVRFSPTIFSGIKKPGN